MTEATGAEAGARIEEMAHQELYRVFRWALKGVTGETRVTLSAYGSGEPYVRIESRDGFTGVAIATIMDVLGPNLDLSVGAAGAITITCPSWVPFS